MAVHVLRLPTEPAAWATSVALGDPHLLPEWPESTRFTLVVVVKVALRRLCARSSLVPR